MPFALVGGTATGTGRGEVVTPVEDNGTWWWVVVFSDEGLSTPSVYGAYDLLEGGDHDYRIRPPMLEALRAPADAERLAVFLYNDLEDAAFYLRPDLQAAAEAALECGASYALLSGSGPTMLALAADAEDARAIAGRLAERGYDRTAVVHGPVAGAHVVAYGEQPAQPGAGLQVVRRPPAPHRRLARASAPASGSASSAATATARPRCCG